MNHGLKRKNLSLVISGIAVLAFALVLTFYPSAVDNNGDLTNKLLIVTIGVDVTKDGLTVSGVSAEPQATGSDGGVVVTTPVSASGRSINECITKIGQRTGKTVDLGLCGVIVLGPEVAREGVTTLLETVLTENLVSPGAFLVQAEEQTAKQFIERSTKLAGSSAVVLTSLIKEAQSNTDVTATTLLRFLSDVEGESECACIPLISATEVKSGGGEQAQSGGSGSEQKYEVQPIERLAVFKKGRLIDKLTVTQSKGFTWLDKHTEKGTLVCENFIFQGENLGTVSADLVGRSCRVKAKFDGDNPVVTLKAKAKLKSADRERVNKISKDKKVNAKAVDLSYEENFKKEIENQINATLEFCKKNDCDLFGFSVQLYRFRNREYKRFRESDRNLLEEVDVSVEIKVEIQ